MPVYEYKCVTCCAKIEILQKMSDAPLTVCTACGGELKKLITNTSFVLKGSGWYVSDYPSSDRKKSLGEGKPAAKTETKSETATETKTAPGKEAVNT